MDTKTVLYQDTARQPCAFYKTDYRDQMKEAEEVKTHFKSSPFSRVGKCFRLYLLKVHHHLIKILRKGMRVAKLALKEDNLKRNKSELNTSSGSLAQTSRKGGCERELERGSPNQPERNPQHRGSGLGPVRDWNPSGTAGLFLSEHSCAGRSQGLPNRGKHSRRFLNHD